MKNSVFPDVVKGGLMLSAFLWSIRALYKKTKWETDDFFSWIGRDGLLIAIGLAFFFYMLFVGIGWLQPTYNPDAVDPYLSR